jgi:heme-degrading monooxygenase HmoA
MPYVVIRHYKDATKLIDELAQRSDDVENLIRGVPGFIAYNLVRSESGGFSVSVYQDRAGAEESVRAAREYLQQNLSAVSAPPEVIQGEAVISFNA